MSDNGVVADGRADGRPSPGGTTVAAVRWNTVAVAGRQAFLFVSSIVLARVLGPESYGVISAATIYVTFTTLLLDQGLASALIQRPALSRWAAGAVASANIASGLLLAGLTFLVAPWVAEFFRLPELVPILRWLGLGLVVKSLAIAPRAMQARSLTFRPIAVADVLGAAVGGVAGVVAALLGAGPSAVVFQVVALDLVVAFVLVRAGRGPVPNLRVRELRQLLPFGLRVMLTNGIAYFSRNIDNILVARVLGVVALSYYGMAYRVLVIPVQMIGQTVSRVTFPVFSRLADRPELLARHLLDAVRLLAWVTVPLMGLAAAASYELVAVVLGDDWMPAAPLLAVLAVAGARETVFYVTAPLMKATGQVKLLVRYEVLATAAQVTGIVVGLRWGVLGVAVGYAAAGFVLTPVILAIHRRLGGITGRQQVRALLPPVHAAAWGAAAYLLVARAVDGRVAVLALGTLAYVCLTAGVLAVVHRADSRLALERLLRIVRRTSA
ncbi:lipopolysaccharide biosynthesis protein [Actinotalea ferrariae]|uniref:lipopolysaccharide biosynthesis protein n=1 Tax=Actinotalea ferrariae TaxID=1386098 RepID=UPI001C8C9E1A|nr:lipopolysaccharide biosynthesis protein [Actinotalea ferrariae]MBX9245321.1 lipopolysaccharide biosynthesis protein [Actinotalea ferrariae]